MTELETLAVVWGVIHFRYYLYGHQVTVYTDHAAVKAVLGTPNLTGKHARWWSRVHGSGMGKLEIVHRAGKENYHTYALSCQPNLPVPLEEDVQLETQVAKITSARKSDDIVDLLEEQPTGGMMNLGIYSSQQLAQWFSMSDGMLYRLNTKQGELPQIVDSSSLFTEATINGRISCWNPSWSFFWAAIIQGYI